MINDYYYQLASEVIVNKEYKLALEYVDLIDDDYPDLELIKSTIQSEYGLLQQLVGES